MGNPFNQIMGMLSSGKNPNFIVQQMMKTNPQISQMINQIQNSAKSNNMTSKEYALQWFKQQGIPENQVMQIAHKMGIK